MNESNDYDEIAELIRRHPGRYKWNEDEMVKWIDSLEPRLRIGIDESMRQDFENGYSMTYVFETLHEARVQMERKPSVWTIIYSLFRAWQETGKEMYQGDAMENLANLDMEKFGKR